MSETRPRDVIRVGRPPGWYGWAVRFMLTVTVLLATLALTIAVVYVAPAVKSLAEDSAIAKRQAACYDKLSARITDANAGVVVGIGALVVLLAAPQRDRPAIDHAILVIDQYSRAYPQTIQERARWVRFGRTLPCPIS